MDASNLFKPALQSGELRCMGSTTYKEYRQHFEKDRALARRFQKIDVVEPSVPDAIKILQGLKPYFEDFHDIRFTNEALKSGSRAVSRYMGDRKLPDKAIDVIDEAGAPCASCRLQAQEDHWRQGNRGRCCEDRAHPAEIGLQG
jgi:ATP-dependent Clp protease ATP-binding subunit ClpA